MGHITDYFTVVILVSQPLSECEADVGLVLIPTSFFVMEIMLTKYKLVQEQHDLHNKARRVAQKQRQLRPRFHL